MNIQLPHNYNPRSYQLPLFQAIDSGIKRAVVVWHRRAGKDLTLFNLMIKKAVEKVGIYYYFFPTYAQGKKILWEGIDKQGIQFLNRIPTQLVQSKNDSEMKITLINGSIIRVIGTDNYNSIMGTNPIGCVFSEYSLQNPMAWNLIKPILKENKGWAIFNFTPRGKNHGWTIYQMAKKNPNWFCQRLTINDTFDEQGIRVFTDQDMAEERAEGMDEDLIQQEYYCSFEGNIQGSYYGKLINKAEEEGRIGKFPYDPSLPVDTTWDLGIGDSTAIWFTQQVGNELRCIDYYETTGEGLKYYIDHLDTLPYRGNYGEHNAPHDIEVREFSTGMSRMEFALKLGFHFRTTTKLSIDDGIDAARRILPICYFDEDKCEQGLNALRSYHKEWDDKRVEYKNKPFHDWASHGADAFRYRAISYREGGAGQVITGGELATSNIDAYAGAGGGDW